MILKKLFHRWYVSLVLLPVIINYFTEIVELPEILSNWEYTIIFSLLILVVILGYELLKLKSELNIIQLKPRDNDKRIVSKLISVLDLKMFQEDIVEQNAWYGYKKEAIGKTIDLVKDVKLIEYKTANEQLNQLISDFAQSLEEFHRYSSKRLFGGNGYYVPNKDTEEAYKKSEAETEKMNQLTKACFMKLEELMKYVSKHKYLD